MRRFHLVGLPGLRVPAPNGPWPLVLPGSLVPPDVEATLAAYQASVGPELLDRIEFDHEGELVPSARRLLASVSDTGDPSTMFVVVRLAGRGTVEAVQREPLLARFAHLAVVVPYPGGGEPLGPLLALNDAVWQRLEELYEPLAERLGLGADLSGLDDARRDFRSPADLVRLVNDFVALQLQDIPSEDAAERAISLRAAWRARVHPQTRQALLPTRSHAEGELLRAQGLMDDDGRLVRWAARIDRTEPSPYARPRAQSEVQRARSLAVSGQLEAAEALLRSISADPLSLQPRADAPPEERDGYWRAVAALFAQRRDFGRVVDALRGVRNATAEDIREMNYALANMEPIGPG